MRFWMFVVRVGSAVKMRRIASGWRIRSPKSGSANTVRAISKASLEVNAAPPQTFPLGSPSTLARAPPVVVSNSDGLPGDTYYFGD